MSEPIVYISHFKVKQGSYESWMQLTQKATEQLKANKPGTVAFLQFTDQDRTELSIIHVFPDAQSFDRHVEGAAERAKSAFEFLEPTSREVYGKPSEQVLSMLKPPQGSGIAFRYKPEPTGGFLRLRQA
jgi:quinol monooxygenase YgiN